MCPLQASGPPLVAQADSRPFHQLPFTSTRTAAMPGHDSCTRRRLGASPFHRRERGEACARRKSRHRIPRMRGNPEPIGRRSRQSAGTSRGTQSRVPDSQPLVSLRRRRTSTCSGSRGCGCARHLAIKARIVPADRPPPPHRHELYLYALSSVRPLYILICRFIYASSSPSPYPPAAARRDSATLLPAFASSRT
jgi:hypothetical protein